MEVPGDYGGILDPKVVSDVNGNVTELPAAEPEDPGFTTEQAAEYNSYYERLRAVEQYTSLLAYLPVEGRPINLDEALAGAEKVEKFLANGNPPVQ